jgi:phage gpG-like protein
MAIKISLEVDGLPEFDRTFSRLDLNLKDLRPVFETVRDEFWRIEKEQFAGEGVGKTGKWKPLSKGYIAKKIAKYGANLGILRATDAMRKSLTGKTGDTVLDIQPDSISIGTSLSYALKHQRGTNVKQRPVIDFNDDQKTRMTKAIQKSMLVQMKKEQIPAGGLL